MAAIYIRASLLFILVSVVLIGVQARPRFVRDTASDDTEFSVVTTNYGPVKGRRFTDVDDYLDLEIFLGIPYAKPPVGELRLARPEPHDPWTETRDALKHGAKCIQKIIPEDPVLANVPFSEDCLFLDIYTPSHKNGSTERFPVMMFIHGGGYYGGSGAKYNFTNVALRGVTVISVSYRLDVFGFLSTQDDVIPGNFALLDNILALDWIKDNIAAFGGNPDLITIFGGSAGAAISSIMILSPLSKGKFSGAIMQSGASNCHWAVNLDLPGYVNTAPRELAKVLGTTLNCTLTNETLSQDLLTCLRSIPAEVLVNQSIYVQALINAGFNPVVETTFGVIPDTPIKLLRNSEELHYIPTMYGYTDEDGSFTVSDPDNDGITLREFQMAVQYMATRYYAQDDQDTVYNNAIKTYLPADPSKLSKSQLRELLVKASTGAFFVGRMIQEARYLRNAKDGRRGGESDPQVYVFNFNHRPSYSPNPEWMGVAHADEKGFVLGLPVGPDPFMYPIHDSDDEKVRDFVVTTWTNFAKYQNPTPTPVQSVTWPQFKAGAGEKVMVIETSPYVKDFDREEDVRVWGSFDGNGNAGNRVQASMSWWMLGFVVVTLLETGLGGTWN